MAEKSKTALGVWLVVLSSIFFGLYGVWSKLMGDTFEPFFQSWVRALMICLALLPILIATKSLVPIKRRDRGWLAVFIVFTSATTAPIYYAFNHMDISSAYLLFFVGVMVAMQLIGVMFFGEKFTPLKIISLVAALAGLYLLFSFSLAEFTLLAASMALLNGVASGGEIAFSKKLVGYSPLYLAWLSWLAIFITNGLVSVFVGEPQVWLAITPAWGYMLAYAATGLLGFWLVLKGIKYIEATIGGLLSPLEAVFGVLFGIIVFNEVLSGRLITGGILIVLAAMLPHLTDWLKSHKQKNGRLA